MKAIPRIKIPGIDANTICFMLDVETTGLSLRDGAPGSGIFEAHMTSIALVEFNFFNPVTTTRVNHQLIDNSDVIPDKKTQEFRDTHHIDYYEEQLPSEYFVSVAIILATFIKTTQEQSKQELKFVLFTKHSFFDVPLLQAAYAKIQSDYRLPFPFHYRQIHDVSELLLGRGLNPQDCLDRAQEDLHLYRHIPKPHTARYDCLLQIKMLQKAFYCDAAQHDY